MELVVMLLLLNAAAPAGWPCNPCTTEQIRELGIVAPPREVLPACYGDDDPTADLARWIKRPANCVD